MNCKGVSPHFNHLCIPIIRLSALSQICQYFIQGIFSNIQREVDPFHPPLVLTCQVLGGGLKVQLFLHTHSQLSVCFHCKIWHKMVEFISL